MQESLTTGSLRMRQIIEKNIFAFIVKNVLKTNLRIVKQKKKKEISDEMVDWLSVVGPPPSRSVLFPWVEAAVGYELLRADIRFTVLTTQWYRNIFSFLSQNNMSSTYFSQFFRSISKSVLSLTTDEHTDFALALHVNAIRGVPRNIRIGKKLIILSNAPANRLLP